MGKRRIRGRAVNPLKIPGDGIPVAKFPYNPLEPCSVVPELVPVMAPTVSWPPPAGLSANTPVPSVPFPSDDVVELPLLLPEWQVVALEEAARKRGMTVGQLVRRLFADLFPRRS
jgi:hypothetical protein